MTERPLFSQTEQLFTQVPRENLPVLSVSSHRDLSDTLTVLSSQFYKLVINTFTELADVARLKSPIWNINILMTDGSIIPDKKSQIKNRQLFPIRITDASYILYFQDIDEDTATIFMDTQRSLSDLGDIKYTLSLRNVEFRVRRQGSPAAVSEIKREEMGASWVELELEKYWFKQMTMGLKISRMNYLEPCSESSINLVS